MRSMLLHAAQVDDYRVPAGGYGVAMEVRRARTHGDERSGSLPGFIDEGLDHLRRLRSHHCPRSDTADETGVLRVRVEVRIRSANVAPACDFLQSLLTYHACTPYGPRGRIR